MVSKYDAKAYRKKLGGRFKQIPPEKIAAWLERHFDVKPRKQGQELRICNPFDSDSKFKFSVSPEKGLCHDWRGDGWAGPVNPKTGKRNCSFVRFVRLYRKCSYKQAIEEILDGAEDLDSYLRPDGRVTDPATTKIIEVKLPLGLLPLTTSTDIAAKPVKAWLKSRGYTDETIAKADLQHIGFEVYWPYYEFDVLVYWQSRSRLNKRFKFPPVEHFDNDGKLAGISEVSKTDFWYGFDEIDPASYAVITEAIFDMNTLGRQCLASGGAALDPKQIKKLRILGPRKGVILAPDNDKAGLKSVLQNTQLLEREKFKVFFSIPPEIEYIDEDGKKKKTSDWNDMFAKAGIPLKEVRAIHDKGIKKATSKNLISIRRRINAMGKNR
jgi:hypothetical protein